MTVFDGSPASSVREGEVNVMVEPSAENDGRHETPLGLLKAKTEALAQASMKIGEILYRQQQENPTAGGTANDATGTTEAPPKGAKDGDVIDADFTDIDEDDKKANG